MQRLTISLVTPTYNQAGFLADTVTSVLTQDAPVEYLVIDDGSTDQTIAILKGFGDQMAWRSRPNRGQTATINEGWDASTGDVLGWLNSDDTLLPGAVSYVLDFFEHHPEVAVFYGSSIFVDSSGRPLGPPSGRPFDYQTLLRRCENPIPQPSAFIRRSLLDAIGPLDETLYYFMDWDYWLRAGLRHRIAHAPVPLSTYRVHPDAKGEAASKRFAPELRRVYEKFFEDPSLPQDILALREESTLHASLTSAGYLLRGGAPREARRLAVDAVVRSRLGLVRARAVHKALYCAFGETAPYIGLRWFARETLRLKPTTRR